MTLVGLAALMLPAGGYCLYRHATQTIRGEKQSELSAFTELKTEQIAEWRKHRLANARANSTGLIRTYVDQWLKGSVEASLEAGILARLRTLRDLEELQNMVLVAPDGRLLLSLDSRLEDLDPNAKQLVAQALASHEVVFGDFFRCPTCGEVHLDVAAPILDPHNRPVAALILRSDAEEFLYQFVQSWPTPSRSGETLLIRRDGDDALFLNQLRHRPDPALSLRIPLSRSDSPAVQAALGKTGEFEGRDYRGVQVLAEIMSVPDSPWIMVAKVDTEEILAEARYRGRFVLLFTALSMLVTGAIAAFIFSLRQKHIYQDLYRAEYQGRHVEEAMLRESEQRSKLDEARANTLLELSQMTDRSAAEIANHAMESAIRLTGSTIGYIAFANEDETVLTMHYWSNSAMQECAMIDKPIVYPVKDTGLWGEAIRQRKAVITNDYAAPNPLKKGTPSGHVRLTRHMNIPVFDGGRIVAVAGVGNKAEDYQDDDVQTVDAVHGRHVANLVPQARGGVAETDQPTA